MTGSTPDESDPEYGGAVIGSTVPAPAGDTGATSSCSCAPRSARNSSAGSRPLPNGSGWNREASSTRPTCGSPLLGWAGDHCSGAEAGPSSRSDGEVSPSGRARYRSALPAAETGRDPGPLGAETGRGAYASVPAGAETGRGP